MIWRRLALGSGALIALLTLAVPEGLDSCAIGPPGPVFVTRQRPPDLEQAFVQGNFGVLWPSFRTDYLIAAYGVLNGARMTGAEVSAMFHPDPEPAPLNAAAGEWLSAKKTIPGGSPVPFYLNPYKSAKQDDRVLYFLNCQGESFRTALETLHQRSAKWGADSPNLKDWMTAQDQVFANCSGNQPVIPAALPESADTALKADRDYQIAAAYFYSGNFPKARDLFQQIANNGASPWSHIAPYLVARTYLREASLEDNPASLAMAQATLQHLVSDPARQDLHEAAVKLLDYIEAQADPISRLRALSAKVSDPGGLRDFVYLCHSIRNNKEKAGQIPQAGDLADWLNTVETFPLAGTSAPGSSRHAVERWREGRQPAWLIAALMTGNSDDDLLAAAHAFQPGSPGYETVAYHGIVRSKPPAARTWAAEVLKGDLTVSTRNLLRGISMGLAQSFSEFLSYAARLPEPKLQNFDSQELEADPGHNFAGAAMFDTDVAIAFNQRLPLRFWADAAASHELPPELRIEIAQAEWVRAVLLDRDAAAHMAMEQVEQIKPGAFAAAKEYLASGTPEDRLHIALFLLLRSPDLLPLVPSETRGGRDLNRFSDLGAGQWSFREGCRVPAEPPKGKTPSLAFLKEEDEKEEQLECDSLKKKAAAGANWLAEQTLAWAKTQPGDPRVPQALHLVVQATRRGATDAATGNYSRKAFALLHSRYPDSDWAKKTKYWYSAPGAF